MPFGSYVRKGPWVQENTESSVAREDSSVTLWGGSVTGQCCLPGIHWAGEERGSGQLGEQSFAKSGDGQSLKPTILKSCCQDDI